MSWSRPSDLKAQLERLWQRGDLLRDAATGGVSFPLRMVMKGPTSTDISERFDAVRTWAAELAAIPYLRVEWRDIRHRVQGTQRLPASVWVDSIEDAARWLNRYRERDRFLALMAATREAEPMLLPWLTRRPLQALELEDVWPSLLAVVGWLRQHPRPGIYLRQADIPGVHSKFIERHRRTLAELLDLALSPEAIDIGASGVSQFSRRYGFVEKPVHIRFRSLDPAIVLLPGPGSPDIVLDANSFSSLQLQNVARVFITENETNFLAFPPVANALILFGAGYGWEPVARARWLRQCELYYWGDIDTHGFAILNQLRRHFPQVRSLLMDRDTLNTHDAFWGTEEKPSQANLPMLTPEEGVLYDDLRYHRLRPNLRLEQEHVGFRWLGRCLHDLLGGS